jgi:hypothetical protein
VSNVNETLVEVVRFQASGIDEITARLKVFAQQTDEAQRRQKALMGLMNDPKYQQHAQKIATINRQTELMALKLRNAQQAHDLASGAALAHAKSVAALSREAELSAMKLRNQQLAADLASGAFYRHAAATAKLNAEHARLQKQANLQALVAEHGKLGGVLRHNAAEFATLKSVATVGYLGITGLAVGLVRAGLQGTVQGYKLEYAWTRLGRQAAAIAVPAVEKLASWVGRLAGWFERLSPRQQNLVLTLGLIAVAAGPAITAMRTLYTTGVAALSIGRTVASVMGLASTAGAAAQATAAAAGGAGSAAAGGAGRAGAGAMAGRLLLRAAPVLLPLAAAAALTQTSDYERMRFEGHGKLKSTVGAGIGAMYDLGHAVFGGNSANELDATRAEMDKRMEKKRREVMPLEVGLGEAGDKAQSIQEELLKVSSARDETAEANTEAVRRLTQVLLDRAREIESRWGDGATAAERARGMRD